MPDGHRPSPLPQSLAPRGLNRCQAAAYIGVSPTKLDEMIKDGRMPKPKRIDGRTVWDRVMLDESFEALPDEANENPWDRALGGINAGHIKERAG